MNVNIDNLEHVLNTLTGFESLSNGDLESPDSVYAKTVLKLNGVDFKHREGTEGFMSSVKAGAQKVYEMIKNFIKAIRDFFFGSKKETGKIVNSVQNNLNSIEKSKKTRKEHSSTFNKSLNSGDVSTIRTALFMEMNDKRNSTSDIIDIIEHGFSKHPDLFVPYEENAYSQEINQDKGAWDTRYYHTQELYATSNFSSKRIRHLVVVREHVFNLPPSSESYFGESFKNKGTLQFQIKTLLDLSFEMSQVSETIQNGNYNKGNFEKLSATVKSRKIDFKSQQTFLELVSKTSTELQALKNFEGSSDLYNELDKICKEIKKTLPELKKIGDEVTLILDIWTETLNKCNEECKGRNISDETWILGNEEKTIVKEGITRSTAIIKQFKRILNCNTEILEQLNSQTSKWKKYLEQ